MLMSQSAIHPIPHSPKLLVYSSRHKHQVGGDPTNSQHTQPLEQIPLQEGQGEARAGQVLEDEEPLELDLLIALSKGKRTCTHHPMSKFVSTNRRSPTFSGFTSTQTAEKTPKGIGEALADPKWAAAIQDEIKALKENHTWEVVSLSNGKRPVDCKCVFTIKFNVDGNINRYKARLVAKGFTHMHGIDYKKTFAPVAKLNSIRVLLSLAACLDWPLLKMDVKNAFLNSDLHEEVYVDIPPGFEMGEAWCASLRNLYIG